MMAILKPSPISGDTHPRVLLIARSLLNDVDSGSASLRNWFKDWPTGHIAQLFTYELPDQSPCIAIRYQLGANDRRLGRLFFLLKRSFLGDGVQPFQSQRRRKTTGLSSLIRRTLAGVGRALTQSGFWELIFVPKISNGMRNWIQEFKPDVLFVQASGVYLNRLGVHLSKQLSIPLCVNIVDDWVEHIYEKGVFAKVVGKVVRQSFTEVLRWSSIRFVIGTLMAQAYEQRFAMTFRPLMQCDDIGRFDVESGRAEFARGECVIVYSGTLWLGRWESIIDLANAVEGIQSNDLAIKVIVYTQYVSDEMRSLFAQHPSITVRSAPKDKDLPGILRQADILFLPESFQKDFRVYTRLSVSTKAHLFMMSGRPCLAYGPPEIGTIEYAIREEWASVVDSQDVVLLGRSLCKLISDSGLRSELVSKAREVAFKNHEGRQVRQQLLLQLRSISQSNYATTRAIDDDSKSGVAGD